MSAGEGAQEGQQPEQPGEDEHRHQNHCDSGNHGNSALLGLQSSVRSAFLLQVVCRAAEVLLALQNLGETARSRTNHALFFFS
mmetsp:Transcript_40335/g.102096  ORF Transcript_40335/g.102096 Transcript_40335/m.102096 type:complete len:83 (+) Transcript_40335:1977-2225(+)